VTRVSIPETLLIYVGAPVAIYGAIVLAVLGPGMMRGAPARYRPGRPWSHAPAWFVPHPQLDAPVGAPAIRPGHPAPELADHARDTSAVGGASGEW
jgi:hypothetical protein